VEVVASLSQGRTAAAQCGLFTYNSVPVIFEPPCVIAFSTFCCQYQLIYDEIYLLTTIGLTPGGSNTVHIYTQTIHRAKQ